MGVRREGKGREEKGREGREGREGGREEGKILIFFIDIDLLFSYGKTQTYPKGLSADTSFSLSPLL